MSNTQKLAYSLVSIHDVFTDRHECTAYTQRHRQSSEMIFCHRSLEIIDNSWPLPERNSFASTFRVLAVWYQSLAIMAGHYQFFLRFGFWQYIYFKYTLFLFLKNWIFSVEAFWGGFVLLHFWGGC